jgi:hypothetical protein
VTRAPSAARSRRAVLVGGAALLAGGIAAAGCSRSRRQRGPARMPTVPAGGVVTHRGKPVAKASVVFLHEGGSASAVGTTDAEARFALTTYSRDDGAPVGKYRMTVAMVDTTEIEPGVLAPLPANCGRPGVPANYANAATSGLTCEIAASGNPEIRIELK